MNKDLLERLENNYYVLHSHSERVKAEIFRFIQMGRRDESLCIVGPTGAGKTLMAKRVVMELSKQLDNGWRPGYGYPILIEAPSQFKKDFPWRAFLEELLHLLGEGNLTKKVDLELSESRRKCGERPPSTNKLTISQLERLIRLRIEVLKPIAILIDEAQNLVEGLSLSNRRENVNRLKYWANTMGTKFLLFGTHESKDILNLNEQLSRRISPVYFPRYRKTQDDLKEFAAFYKSLINGLDIKISPKINQNFLYIYNHSLGCPGLLSTWLQRCIGYCIDSGLPSISEQVFRKHRFTKDRLIAMETAIKEFEVQYLKSLEEFNPDSIQVEYEPFQKSMVYATSEEPPPKKIKRRPGQQHPKRYKVHED